MQSEEKGGPCKIMDMKEAFSSSQSTLPYFDSGLVKYHFTPKSQESSTQEDMLVQLASDWVHGPSKRHGIQTALEVCHRAGPVAKDGGSWGPATSGRYQFGKGWNQSNKLDIMNKNPASQSLCSSLPLSLLFLSHQALPSTK